MCFDVLLRSEQLDVFTSFVNPYTCDVCKVGNARRSMKTFDQAKASMEIYLHRKSTLPSLATRAIPSLL
jgi:hypothetical protein